jgi:hypothetical protein
MTEIVVISIPGPPIEELFLDIVREHAAIRNEPRKCRRRACERFRIHDAQIVFEVIAEFVQSTGTAGIPREDARHAGSAGEPMQRVRSRSAHELCGMLRERG